MATTEQPPTLTEAHIRELASAQSFERGMDYFHSEAILEPVRQGMTLRAACEGSEYEPYQVSATLTLDGIGDTDCTCPYDWGGLCKHIVALLLTYVHTPDAFHAVPPLHALLAKSSKADLIALIGAMLEREPGLMTLVEATAATRRDRSVDLETCRRQVRRALRQDSLRAIEKDLQAWQDAADRLARAGEWQQAGAVYQVLLAESVSQYDDELQMLDEDGDIALLVDAYAQGLRTCLQNGTPDHTTRRAWLEALLEAVLTDIELGGIDLAPSAREAVLAHATTEDWTWIEPLVREQARESHDWAREALVDFLSDGQAQQGREADAAALIRELGTPEQQIFLLIEEGKIDEARRRLPPILDSKPGLLTRFADALVAAGADAAAVALVTEHAGGKRTSGWGTDWLARYYRQHGRPQEAVAWQRQAFLQHPSVEAFDTLRQVSRKAGTWDQVRADVLDTLRRGQHVGPLIEIALHEGEVMRALELLPQVNPVWRHAYSGEVARAAEQDHPQEAIALYKELVERAIGGRQRRTYQQAARHLTRLKALYTRLEAQSDWETYVQTLRTSYTRLPALHDELRRARL
jgi:uncharacterized Zn finger protein